VLKIPLTYLLTYSYSRRHTIGSFSVTADFCVCSSKFLKVRLAVTHLAQWGLYINVQWHGENLINATCTLDNNMLLDVLHDVLHDMLQVFHSLLKAHAVEARAVVRQALEILTPAMPGRMEDGNVSPSVIHAVQILSFLVKMSYVAVYFTVKST